MARFIAITALMLALGSPTLAQTGDSCPVPGEMEHWQADYCMGQVGTDDIIAAQPCLEKEWKRIFRSACTAKLHYKRRMCEQSIRRSGAGSVEECVKDPLFQGFAVRNGGV
ncbi:MAG: hypothetical protein FWG81_02975 [Betaproteobacteria bacterium]|nr:hypothetical protein [Betaproteobacteria bacterium]